jgi:hypothetical protein
MQKANARGFDCPETDAPCTNKGCTKERCRERERLQTVMATEKVARQDRIFSAKVLEIIGPIVRPPNSK